MFWLDACLDNLCAGDPGVSGSEIHWQIMLSDAYDKKRQVLMAAGDYLSAAHVGRLSLVLQTDRCDCWFDVTIITL